MFNQLKKNLDKYLPVLIDQLDQRYQLKKISPLLYSNIKEFILRDGKRIRPILFICGFKGYSKNNPKNMFFAALAFELLHDFLLIHDDIVDKSDLRRGKPSLHTVFNKHLQNFKQAKFSGQDLSIVAADVIYALAIDAFLSIDCDKIKKEAGLNKFIKSAVLTGSGEFIELLLSVKPINKVSKSDIYKIYDLKTANYTFSSPLSIGASLAGADKHQINKLIEYGICLGRAFQIKDDILGMFESEQSTGKSSLTDLQEAKRTLLIWHSYNHSNKSKQDLINRTFNKKTLTSADLLKIRKIINDTKTLDYAKDQITYLSQKAKKILNQLSLNPDYKQALNLFAEKILTV